MATATATSNWKTEFTGKDNYGNPKSNYLEKIAGMDAESFKDECESKIWLSAYASNNPRSDYHWHCDACWHESNDRGGTPTIYEKAYNAVSER